MKEMKIIIYLKINSKSHITTSDRITKVHSSCIENQLTVQLIFVIGFNICLCHQMLIFLSENPSLRLPIDDNISFIMCFFAYLGIWSFEAFDLQ